jgi:hypothetical protein
LELMETKAHARHHAAERKRKRLQGSA